MKRKPRLIRAPSCRGRVLRAPPDVSPGRPLLRLHYIRSGQLRHFVEFDVSLTTESLNEGRKPPEAPSCLYQFTQFGAVFLLLDTARAGFPFAMWKPGLLGRRRMVNQIHEEHENGKSHLPGPCFLLSLFALFRRRPMSRCSLRRVVSLADQRIRSAKARASMAPPPHSLARSPERGKFYMGRTALPGLAWS